MKQHLTLLLVVLACALGPATANSYDHEYTEMADASEARFLYLNSTSTATSLTLLGALILLGVIFYLVYAGGFLSAAGANNRNDYNYNQGYDNQQYYQARSAGSTFDFSNLNVIQWIQMMQEIYDKFDYNDIECQKRLICEVMQSPEYFGEASEKVRSGFEYAKYLEFLSMPDDFREILDEYIDASERAIGVKTCQEYFDCPYSLKDSVKRNFYGNAL
jgi:hypothetical protein